MERKSRLGRGLDALIGSTEEAAVGTVVAGNKVRVDTIDQNPFQPRKTFDDDEIQALSETIRAHGILQPLVVRSVGDRFQLIAGERRLRAARVVGLESVPVTVVDFNDQQVLEAALVENIHRADLNPIEKAQGFKEYLTRFEMTHEQLAARLGLARSSITNLVSLLELPGEVQEAVRVGQLSTGHAKILKGVEDRERQVSLCREIVARGLSVHATEALLKQPGGNTGETSEEKSPRTMSEKTAHVQGIEDELRQRLSVRIEIKVKGPDRGQFLISFENNGDFERLVDLMRR